MSSTSAPSSDALNGSRDEAIRQADKLLKQGRLDAALAIYAQLVADQPRDWTLANTLGDLYAQAGQLPKAVAAYVNVAEQLQQQGSLPKAAALYKKILKLAPEEEHAELRLAEISVSQHLFADARNRLAVVAARRRARGDHAGAQAVLKRLDSVDPTDFDTRVMTLRARFEADEPIDVTELREVVADLTVRGRADEAIGLLRRSTVSDPMLLITLAELELRGGRLAEGRDVLERVLSADKAFAARIRELGLAVLEQDADAGFTCFDIVSEAAVRDERWSEAADLLQQFLVEAPFHVSAALKLVEICIDGGLEGRMYAAQARLGDAYLAAGKGIEAKLIAQDLLEQEPDLPAHLDRLRRAEGLLRDLNETLNRAGSSGPEAGESSWGPAATASEPVAREDTASQPEAEIDLSAALDEPDDQSANGDCIQLPDVSTDLSLDEAFRAFREEVWRDSSDEAADQQYKLALAYREMDMLEEAVAALELAARSPARRFEAASLLGRIYRDMGLLGEAVDWMERAAETPPPGVDEGRKLLYELGDSLEQLGETARALAVFMELQAEAGEYGDITARIDRLSSS